MVKPLKNHGKVNWCFAWRSGYVKLQHHQTDFKLILLILKNSAVANISTNCSSSTAVDSVLVSLKVRPRVPTQRRQVSTSIGAHWKHAPIPGQDMAWSSTFAIRKKPTLEWQIRKAKILLWWHTVSCKYISSWCGLQNANTEPFPLQLVHTPSFKRHSLHLSN